jgi:hypothetical protein
MKASCNSILSLVSILLAAVLLLSQCCISVVAGEEATAAAASTARDLQDAGEDDMLELQVHAINAPPDVLEAVVADAGKYMNFLLGADPLYDGLAPGESVPEDGDDDGGARGRTLAKEEEEASTPILRGASKGRKLLSTCPTTCAKSSSASCKQVGCAYCGTRCRRRRRERNLEVFGSKLAIKIEGKINARLIRACEQAPDCVMWATILRIVDGDEVVV